MMASEAKKGTQKIQEMIEWEWHNKKAKSV